MKKAIDEILEKNAEKQASLGTDSTEEEIIATKIWWAEQVERILEIDPTYSVNKLTEEQVKLIEDKIKQ